MRTRPALVVLAIVYAAGLAALVTAPIAWRLNRLTVWLYVQWLYTLHLPGSPSPEDFGTALNVLLFVPAGWLVVRLTRWPWWAGLLVCLLASGAIEVTQASLLTGREASLGDVVANGSGALVGVLLAWARQARTTAGRSELSVPGTT